jgi:phosphohistidine phosphatase
MKVLFLVRHAKSSRDEPGVPDRERPLDGRGRHDAPAMGRRLAGRGLIPERVVASPALRALTTARLLADGLGLAREEIVVDERLYASNAGRLLEIVHALDVVLERVMLVGHNPEFAELAHRLSKSIDDMPTCAVAEFHFDTAAWADIGGVAPEKVTFDVPKD